MNEEMVVANAGSSGGFSKILCIWTNCGKVSMGKMRRRKTIMGKENIPVLETFQTRLNL